jgi:CBS-domain-containing membrane protein
MSARVIDVMTTSVVGVRADAPFKQIAARLRDQNLSALPVLDADDTVIGVVSEADLLPKEALEAGYEGHRRPLSSLRHGAEKQKAAGLTADDVMSRPPITLGPFDLVSHAAHLMYDHRVTCLPVVDRGRLAGMITRADVLKVFSRPDADIRHQVLRKVILGEFLANPDAFTVTVDKGVVTLEGRPENAEVGHGVVAAVRHMEGVVAVHDRLSYPSVRSLATRRRP